MGKIEYPENAVAIIGISCRVPGARNKDEFWRNLKEGIDVGHVFTDEELMLSGIPVEEFRSPDYVRRGFILEDVDLFDAGFFGFSPKEAQIVDCQQRLFLECAWEAFEDAGYDPHTYPGVTGVFASSRMSTYLLHLDVDVRQFASPSGFQILIGNDKDYLSSRVSYKLGLTGPTVVVQSACSSSLAAVHFAVESLLSGGCDMALAGGVAIAVPQEVGYLRKEGMIFSSDGYCRAFDSRADGMLGGNGLGIVILKRLEDALAEKDHIYAVIRGSAMNNDGADKIGFTAPSSKGQAAVISEALEIAGIQPTEIGYIECHGTGTILGDPIEIEALSRVFDNSGNNVCAIGSVKTNVGHLDVAAGVCGLIKTALMLTYQHLTPSLNFKEPNPKMHLETTPFIVNTKSQKWESSTLRRAGVSSFGIGGTNVHVVLEEVPENISSFTSRNYEASSLGTKKLFVLSARSQGALRKQLSAYRMFLETTKESLTDICFTTQVGRKHFSFRFAAIVKTKEELVKLISEILEYENFSEQTKTNKQVFYGRKHEKEDCIVSFSSEADITRSLSTPLLDDSELCANYLLPREDLLSVARLYVRGAEVKWELLYKENLSCQRVPLPTYPFERQRYWFAKKASATNIIENSGNDIYQFSWQKQKRSVVGNLDGHYLVVGENREDRRILCETLVESGASCTEIALDDKGVIDFLKRIDSASGVIYLATSHQNKFAVSNWEDFFTRLSKLLEELTNKKDKSRKIRLILVTRGGQNVFPSETIFPLHGALWGYGRFIGFEYPDLQCLRVDLGTSDDDFSLLIKELEGAATDSQVAFRKGERYVMRLVQAKTNPTIDIKSFFKENASYLITGGLGAIGMECAFWMAERGARNIILLSRRSPSSALKKKISELEKKTVVTVVQGDVTSKQDMQVLFKRIGVEFPPLKGIIHGAGVLDPGDGDRGEIFRQVAAPKISGGWNLHQLSKDILLDFFVCFSSSASMFSTGGSSHFIGPYAASNAFLDALVYYRKNLGLPAQSISWGPWSEIGFMAQHNMTEWLEQQGMKSISPTVGKFFLEKIMCSSVVHCGVFGAEWRKVVERIPSYPERAMFAELVKGEPILQEEKKFSILTELVNSDGALRRERLLEWLRGHVALVLKINPNDVGEDDNLMQLGLDSLVFLELTGIFEKELKIKISLGEFVGSPYLHQLTDLILAELVSFEGEQKEDTSFELQKDPEGRYKPFELTDIQHAYWIGRSGVNDLGDVACHIYFEIQAKDLDLERYQTAWRNVISRHDMLRAIILPDGQQMVLERVPPFMIKENDLRHLSAEETERWVALVRKEMSHQVRKVDEWPLFEIRASRVGREELILHISIDIIIADGYSIYTLMKEVDRFYQNPLLSLPPLECTFRDYVRSEASFRESESYRNARKYWCDRIDSFPDAPELPLFRVPSELQQTRFNRREFHLNPEQWDNFQRIASKHSLTRSNALLCAFAEIIGSWSKSLRFCLNLTFFQRMQNHEQVNEVIGDFTSLILLDVHLHHDVSFAQRATQLQKQLWRDMEYRQFSGVRVLQELSKIRGETVTMPVVFTSNLGYESLSTDTEGLSLPGELVYSISQTPQVWIDNQVSEDKNGLLVFWDAVEELFPEGMLDDMFKAYRSLIEDLADYEEKWEEKCFTLIPEEQIIRRREINSVRIPITEETLSSLFFRQVEKDSERIAIITSNLQMSYGEAYRRVMGVTNTLLSHNVGKGDLIAVVMEKGWEQVIAVLGVLEAGAAYVPVSPHIPADRLSKIFMDGAIAIVLTSSRVEERIVWPEGLLTFCVDTMSELTSLDKEVRPHPNDLAYLIYTSGSTGIPKGVMIDHRGVVNTLLDINTRFNISSSDRVFALSDLNFDLSVYDIFGTLAAGGSIVIPEHSLRRDPEHWIALINKYRVTVWNSVPALMEMLLEYLEKMKGGVDSLRLALLSGDWIPLTLPNRIRSACKDIQLVSLGGATEASIWSILYPIEEIKNNWKSIPYGKAMANQEVYVLNEELEHCPDFVSGSLFIGGVGLAKGYWNDEKKDKASFITHPISGQRLYRTGDLGRMLPDGNIEFLGRDDSQVKINGYRIELGEIESVLGFHPDVEKTIVIPHKKEGRQYLAAYVVVRESINEEELEKWLSFRLPDYEIPSFFIFLKEFPLTNNGKIDRNRLPLPSFSTREEEYLPPETETERKVLKVWKDVLENEEIGCRDNFFRSGGDSLLATRALLQINTVCDTTLPLVKFFELATVKEQAACIDSMKTGGGGVEDRASNLSFLLEESEKILSNFSLRTIPEEIEFKSPRNILITGCTGFLGIFLLKELLKSTDADIFCLVRAETDLAAKERIFLTFERYEIEVEDSWKNRINGVAGELFSERLGLEKVDWERLSKRIDFILHNAANTSFSSSYFNLKGVNVDGTREIIKLAITDKIKPLHYVATTSVFHVYGETIHQKIMETDELLCKGILPGGYPQSKWVAEKIVRAFKSKGYPFTIYRPGFITGNSNTGISNYEDFVTRIIRGCIQIGLVPKVDVQLDLLPVDFVSSAIVSLALSKESVGKVYHLTNPNTVSVKTVLSWAQNLGLPLTPVSYEKWLKALNDEAQDSANNPLYPLLPMFPDNLSGGEQFVFDSSCSREALKQLGIIFPQLTCELLSVYLNYLKRNELID